MCNRWRVASLTSLTTHSQGNYPAPGERENSQKIHPVSQAKQCFPGVFALLVSSSPKGHTPNIATLIINAQYEFSWR